jgi:hypothetical protein
VAGFAPHKSRRNSLSRVSSQAERLPDAREEVPRLRERLGDLFDDDIERNEERRVQVSIQRSAGAWRAVELIRAIVEILDSARVPLT